MRRDRAYPNTSYREHCDTTQPSALDASTTDIRLVGDSEQKLQSGRQDVPVERRLRSGEDQRERPSLYLHKLPLRRRFSTGTIVRRDGYIAHHGNVLQNTVQRREQHHPSCQDLERGKKRSGSPGDRLDAGRVGRVALDAGFPYRNGASTSWTRISRDNIGQVAQDVRLGADNQTRMRAYTPKRFAVHEKKIQWQKYSVACSSRNGWGEGGQGTMICVAS